MASPQLPVDQGPDGRERAIELDVKRQVARELHDRVAQTLTGMLVDVENFKSEEVSWADVVRQLETVQSSTRQVLQSLRQLLHDLRGEGTIEDGFGEAVNALVSRFSQQTEIDAEVRLSPRWPPLLGRQAYLNLYRILEEALANIRMHSAAKHVQIAFEPYSESEVTMVISDDGRGVDTDQSRPMGLGTVGMRERAVLLGGQLRIESEAGVGTTVRAVFPRALLLPKDTVLPADLLTAREVPA